jgi:hypothetical protein
MVTAVAADGVVNAIPPPRRAVARASKAFE